MAGGTGEPAGGEGAGRRGGKAVRGDIVPSIGDHNLDLPEWARREPEGAAEGVREGEVVGRGGGSDPRPIGERPFPAVVLVAPGCLALLVAAMADTVSSRNGWGDGVAMLIAVAGGAAGAVCFGVLSARSEGGGGVLGPIAVGVSVLVAGTTLMRLV